MLNNTKKVAAIGNFDGIHIGHQRIVSRVCALAQSQQALTSVVTFNPLPARKLYPEKPFFQLMTFTEKWMQLHALGIQAIHRLRFNEALMKMPPDTFVDKVLRHDLQITHCVVGEDFRFGHQQLGDVHLLAALCQKWGLGCDIVSVDGPNKISSTAIRQALTDGDLASAQDWLGQPYAIIGRVMHGQKRGRLIGIPTANIAVGKYREALQGTYIVNVKLHQKSYPGVANLGKRPTVDGSRTLLEVHLFDFSQDLYGKRIQVEFLEKIRDEKRFENMNALRQQIEQDMQMGRAYFESQ